ncbi:DUF4965 and DUF1793 domain-containing protein [Phanerochaete sordida]|uniref:DUF4965 and DUF1793 domain-containing protein n=1 Tax=Phanerochaete sordida TaxID=48140 RepID=A0A9P3GHX5_9APHY|nr:DUF4965 and DUF1793 domain-containing protein [Phanerochaete sordida]
MFSAFPFFLSLNVSYGAWLLKPVLDYASSPNWSYPYAPGDIGDTYPYASGSSVDSSLDIEETGNMLVMVLAHARASGDGSLIGGYYQLLRTWADYLVNNTWLLRRKSVTSDRGSPANSTNLALKGIIAIGAMSQMSEAARQQEDAARYSSIARLYASSWASLAVGSDQHILAAFGDPDPSWTLAYNLFADKWLGTNLFNDSLLTSETKFIQHLFGSTKFSGGPSISYEDTDMNTAWIMFTAMAMNDDTVRDSLIDTLWTKLTAQLTPQRLSTILSPQPSRADEGGSPGVGAIFAPLAFAIPNVTIVVTDVDAGSDGPTVSKRPSGATQHSQASEPQIRRIAGAAAGGVCALLISGTAGFMLWHRGCCEKMYASEDGPRSLTEPTPYTFVSEYPEQNVQSLEQQAGYGSKLTRERTRAFVARSAIYSRDSTRAPIGGSPGAQEMLEVPPPTYYSAQR